MGYKQVDVDMAAFLATLRVAQQSGLCTVLPGEDVDADLELLEEIVKTARERDHFWPKLDNVTKIIRRMFPNNNEVGQLLLRLATEGIPNERNVRGSANVARLGATGTVELVAQPEDLSDAEWALLEPLLPSRKGPVLRRLVDGIFYRLDNSVPWTEVPRRYGGPGVLKARYRRYKYGGAFRHALVALSVEGDEAARLRGRLRRILQRPKIRAAPATTYFAPDLGDGSDLTDAEWQLLLPLLNEHAEPSISRRTIDGMRYRHTHRITWNRIPPRYGRKWTIKSRYLTNLRQDVFRQWLNALEDNPGARRLTVWLLEVVEQPKWRPAKRPRLSRAVSRKGASIPYQVTKHRQSME